MNNEMIIIVNDKEFHFKLKSQAVVTLEKIFEKNIFEIFQTLSFTTIQRIFWEALINKDIVKDANDMMDYLLIECDLVELGNTKLQELAVISGIIKQKDVDEANKEESLEEIKND